MRLAAPVMAATFAASLVRAWVPAPAQRAVFSRAARLRAQRATAAPLKAATTEKELLAEVQQLERSLSASSSRKPRGASTATVQPPVAVYTATAPSIADAELNAADASRAYRCKFY
jgi:hypothetical protein